MDVSEALREDEGEGDDVSDTLTLSEEEPESDRLGLALKEGELVTEPVALPLILPLALCEGDGVNVSETLREGDGEGDDVSVTLPLLEDEGEEDRLGLAL